MITEQAKPCPRKRFVLFIYFVNSNIIMSCILISIRKLRRSPHRGRKPDCSGRISISREFGYIKVLEIHGLTGHNGSILQFGCFYRSKEYLC